MTALPLHLHPDRTLALALAERAMSRGGRKVWRNAVRQGVRVYSRRRDIPGLIDLPDQWLFDKRTVVRTEIIDRLKRALRRERALKIGMPHLYSANRHMAVLAALGGELAAIKPWRQEAAE